MNQRDDATHELISAYVDGELTDDERARVEQLLSSRDEYRQTLDAAQSLATDMRALPTYQLDDQFASRVLVAACQADPSLDSEHRSTFRNNADETHAVPTPSRHWGVGIAIVLTAAAVLLVAFFMGNPMSDSSREAGSLALVDQNPARRLKEPQELDVLLTADAPQTERPEEVVVAPKSGDLEPDSEIPENPAESRAISSDAVALATGSVGERPSDVTAERPGQSAESTGTRQVASPQSISPPSVVARRIMVGPGRNSQKVLLVIDVHLTRAGWESGQFESLLNEAGVAFDSNIQVESDLEKTLLDSRFFDPPNDPDRTQADKSKTPIAIVYVVTRGGAIDRVWQQMKQSPSHFTRVALDMALQPGDMSVFHQLQQLGDAASLQAHDPGQERHNVAHRLVLSPAWTGVPVNRSAGAGGLTAMVSDVPVDPLSDSTATEGVNPNQLAPPLMPGGLLGANVYTEAVFVLRGAAPQSN